MISYNDFLSEGIISSISSFLKQQYNNIFKEPNQNLSNLFTDFTKRIDTERNVSNLYQRYIRNSQTTVQNEINKAETIDEINKIVSDQIKFFYFSLKPVVNKLQNKEFTMQEIFSRSRDKRLQILISYPEDQFSNAVQQYVSDAVIPTIKEESGLNKPKATAAPPEETTERIKYNIYKILEADNATTEEDIVAYKKESINWINTSLFDLIKPKIQLLNQLSANKSNTVDQLSKQMKGTNNDNAKKMILNKIMNMSKEELQILANSLGLKEEEIGKI